MYANPSTWIAIALAGIVGCVATALMANWLRDVPISAVAGNWKKHVWSIIFVIPVPLLLGIGGGTGVFVAYMWLMLAPTIASKVYFGPKDVPVMVLNAFHSAFAVAALVVYVLVTRNFVLAG